MKLKNILNSKSKTITSAAFVLGIASLSSRILGLIRERLFAHFFGISSAYDAYVAAFRLPDLVFLLLVTGALSAGLIPVFTDYLNKNKQKAWELASNIFNIIMLSTIAVCIFLFFAAPYLVPLIVPGFDAAKTGVTVNMTRILFLSPILLAVSSIFSGVLKSFKKFLIVALAPIFYNIGIIIGILFFTKIWGVYGLVLGVVFGALMHVLIQLPSMIQSGFKMQRIFNWHDPGFRRIIRLMPSRSFSLLAAQINLFVITIVASTLSSGSLAIFNYANNLQSLPVAIFGLSFAVAAFPTLADFMSRKARKKFIDSFSNTFRQILFFVVPVSVLMLVLRAQIVRVVLGTGAFDWTATRGTLNALAFFSLSIFAQSVFFLLIRTFHALEDTKTPFIVGLIGAGVNIIASLILAPKMGVAGLALAFSIASLVNMLGLLIALRIRLGYLNDSKIIISTLKIGLASLAAGVTAYKTLYLIEPFVNTHTGIGILTQGLLAGIAGLLIYILFCLIIKLPELQIIRKLIQNATQIS